MSTNKLERLLNLTAVLLDTTRPLAAEELRQKVEGYPPPGTAFHRAFERDKDDLRVLGVPLTVEKVPATDPPVDGYRIDHDDYYLPDPGLAPDELAALHLASLTVRLDGLGDQEALWKLGGMSVGDGETPAVAADTDVVNGVVANIPTDPSLVVLFQAISEKRVVEFVYRDQPRTVDPWRLDFHRGRWYLTGYDRVREDERNFRLDRFESLVTIIDAKVENQQTSAGAAGPIQPWLVGDESPTVAKLLVDADRVAMAARQLGSDISRHEQADGSAVFDVPVVNLSAFRTFVLGFLEYAELLEPAEWRQQIVGWLEDIERGSNGEALR